MTDREVKMDTKYIGKRKLSLVIPKREDESRIMNKPRICKYKGDVKVMSEPLDKSRD